MWNVSGIVVAALCALAPVEGPPTLETVAADPDRYDLGTSALAVARTFRPEVDVARYAERLDALARGVAPRVREAATPEARLGVLATYLYGERGYGDHDAVPPDVFVGLDEVIDGKQWNCLGLSVLYGALGDRLDMPMRVVTGPGHALVAYDGLYVETTDGGAVHHSLDYLKDYLPYPCASPDRFRALDRRETLSMLLAQSTAAAFRGVPSPQAVDLLRRAVAIDEKDAEAWSALGTALAAAGQTEQALEAFGKAVDLDPKLVEALGGLGNAQYAAGKLPEAVATYRRLLEVCDQDPKARYNLAHLLYESGDLEASVAAYRRYIEAAPKDPDGYTGIAFPLEDKGDLEGARDAYTRALQLEPRNAEARINLGLVLAKMGRHAEAIDHYRRALDLRPRSALAYQALGEAYLALNRLDEATRALRTALRLDPENADARAVLEEAQAKAEGEGSGKRSD